MKLIINTEFFLQCHGSCSGCFLTDLERQSENTYFENIFNGLKSVANNYKGIMIDFLVIGFGRGNILNLDQNGIEKLLELIKWSKENFSYKELIVEVSTSLIGKIDKQIEVAKYIVENESEVFFNIVVNSEIVSNNFWNNIDLFHKELSNFRIKKYNLIENNGDILVLNINPKKLPDLNNIKNFTKNYNSPINISIFPFNYGEVVTEKDLEDMKNWSKDLWANLKDKDLNIKNYLYDLKLINISNELDEYRNYNNNTLKSYIFIDKNGVISEGSLSIMGEIDKIRLLDKFKVDLSIDDGFIQMNKNSYCRKCEYQKQCLLSGAYLNLIANNKNIILDKNNCLSGYQKLFELSEI